MNEYFQACFKIFYDFAQCSVDKRHSPQKDSLLILSFWPPLVKWGRIVGINLDTERWSQKMTNYTIQNISHFAICKFWMVQQWFQMVGKANVNQSLKFQPMSNFELNEWSRNHWRRCTMLLHEAEECKNISRHWKRNRFVKLYFCWVLIFLFSKKLVADKLKPHRC